jgi:hypothetical protein
MDNMNPEFNVFGFNLELKYNSIQVACNVIQYFRSKGT